jgi:hypothetical protein
MKVSEVQVRRKQVVFVAGVSPNNDVGTSLFIRDRCRYVRKSCLSLKIFCEFKKQGKKMKSVVFYSR